ncbi:hypothetical protein R1sor_011501 [Riccia sorocarpa]|uniref:Uncharacterized protein n=1 Tax=Riccia sorocarpa TaxID=122646 RepID=A0ABD3I117_9MARC
MGKVLLKLQGRVVALVEVESIDPLDVCLGVVLGPGRMKVAIISVFDEKCPLPYPTQDTDKLQEAIGSYVLWDSVNTVLVENGEPSRSETGGVETAIVPYTGTGADPDAGSPKEDLPDLEIWKNRSHWNGKEVTLLSKEEIPVQIAHGKVLYNESKTSIEGTLLREEFAGVVVFTPEVDVDGSVLSGQLPNFVFGQAHLCRWPINYLRVRENGKVLGDLYVRYAEADLIIYSPPKVSLTHKRVYNSTKRKLLSQGEKDVKAGEHRCQTKCTDEDIRKSMVMDCCKHSCGTKWTVDDIKEVSKDIFGVNFDKKLALDLLYQKIKSSYDDDIVLLKDLTKANHASLPREREEDTRLSGEPLLMDNLQKLKSKVVGLEGEKLALTKKLEDSTEFNSWLSDELKKLNDHVLMLNDHVHKYIDQASVPTTIGPQAKMEIPELSTAPTLVNEPNEFLAEMLG